MIISGFTDEVSSKLDEQLALLGEIGENYMCPRSVDDKNIADYTCEEFERLIKPRLDAAGVRFSSIGSPIGKIKLSDDAAYAAQLKKLAELVKIAQLMDCRYIRFFSFFPDMDVNSDECFNKTVERLRGFLNVCNGSGVVLLHENEKKIFGDVPQRVLRLYDALNSPQFALCFDASNYIQCGVDAFEAYEQTKDKTVYYHMKDCMDGVEVPLGLGQGRIMDIIADLKIRGYGGFLTLEPHTVKYALLKRVFYVCPLLSLAIKNSHRVYKYIDAKTGTRHMQKVSAKQVYLWQYYNLKNMITERNNDNG